MDIFDIEKDPPFGSYELWRALLAIYNHIQREERNDRPFEVRAAIRLLDCWLDVAQAEGWLDVVK